jgi:hypothetical protein
MTKYTNKNEGFFAEPNRLNSYWAGFIAADGNVGKKTNTLAISLAIKDKEHLEKLSAILNPDYVVKTFLTQYSPDYPETEGCRFSFNSRQTKSNLDTNWGIHPNKTFTMEFPHHLSVENKKAFVSGYLDGDGCINVRKGHRGKLQLSICGNEGFLDGLATFLREDGSVDFPNNIYASRNIFVFCVGGRVALKALDFLYGEDLPILGRKWSKYLENKDRKFGQYLSWPKEEEDIIREAYLQKGYSSVKIHQEYFPNRSFASVEKKISYLGLKKRPQPEKKWTTAEDEKLAEAIKEGLTTREIYDIVLSYRTFSSVKNRRRILYNRGQN